MKKYPINLSHLRYTESGQFVHRFVSDFKGTGLDAKTDPNFEKLYQAILQQQPTYDDALGQITAKAETQYIADSDLVRDRKIITIRRAVSVFEYTDDPAEKLAYISLNILMNTYSGLEKDNYESETLGIDNLIKDLRSNAYAPFVTLLGIEKHVANLETAATKFKTIFDARSNKTVSTVVYNAKKLRKNIFDTYTQLVDYVVSTGNINGDAFYVTALTAINNGRKYYADLLAKRESTADDKKENGEEDGTPTPPINPGV